MLKTHSFHDNKTGARVVCSVLPALVEGVYGHFDLAVLAQQLSGIFISVERVHQNQGHINTVHFVQVLCTPSQKRWPVVSIDCEEYMGSF